jgi:hypothetical protein
LAWSPIGDYRIERLVNVAFEGLALLAGDVDAELGNLVNGVQIAGDDALVECGARARGASRDAAAACVQNGERIVGAGGSGCVTVIAAAA